MTAQNRNPFDGESGETADHSSGNIPVYRDGSDRGTLAETLEQYAGDDIIDIADIFRVYQFPEKSYKKHHHQEGHDNTCQEGVRSYLGSLCDSGIAWNRSPQGYLPFRL